jgi:hypothetical protein
MRHSNGGTQAKPPSTIATLRVGNFSKIPSNTKLAT